MLQRVGKMHSGRALLLLTHSNCSSHNFINSISSALQLITPLDRAEKGMAVMSKYNERTWESVLKERAFNRNDVPLTFEAYVMLAKPSRMKILTHMEVSA